MGGTSSLKANTHSVNVIVPFSGPSTDLAKSCFEGIAKQECDCRLIIVSDMAEEWAEIVNLAQKIVGGEIQHVVLPPPRKGFVQAINAGLRCCHRDLDVLLLNSDATMARGCLDGLINATRGSEKIGVIGPLTNDRGHQSIVQHPELAEEAGLDSKDIASLSADAISELVAGNSWREVHTVSFFCALLANKAVKTIGGLSNHKHLQHGLWADNEWCLRAEKAGFRLALHLGAFCDHNKQSQTFARLKLPREQWKRQTAKWYFNQFGRQY